MKKPARYKRPNNILNRFFVLFLFAPLFILKTLGDFLINGGKIIPSAFSRSYNFIAKTVLNHFFLLFIFLKQLLKKGGMKKSKITKVQKRKEVIFNNEPFYDPLTKKVRELKKEIRRKILRIRHIIRFKIQKLVPVVKLAFLKIKYFFLGAFFISVVVSLYQIDVFVKNLPNPSTLKTQDLPATTKILDRNGSLLYEVYADENRTPIALTDIPRQVKQATIAMEDKNFYLHPGISLGGIIRAFYHNLSSSDNLEGGSTITQQLIRSAFLTPEKTFTRKIKEIILAFWTERLYSKDQILEMYLNQVPYGGTAWGIEAASQTYFGKSVKDLTLAEASLLAGLPAAPTQFSPFNHPELAKFRQEEVLDRMAADGYLTRETAESAKKEPLNFRQLRISIAAPHFVMYVKELLEKYYGPKLVAQGGLRVTTTLDLSLQEMAQKTVTNQIESLKHLSVGNGAALITNPATGEILSMVGSRNYFDEKNDGKVNVTTSLRQPGSSIKVVTYATALENGYTAASILDDSPITYAFAGRSSYSPVNYDGKYHGRITLRTALGSSYNIPAVKLLAGVGMEKMIEQGKRMGITTWEDTGRFGLSLTLGGGEVTMLDMAKVYGTLASGGKLAGITPFVKITDYKGNILPLPILNSSKQALSPQVAFILSSILSDNNARAPAFGPNSALVIPGKTVSVKTGTSDSKRDNWTIGYTPDYVVTVWVGNNNNSPMHPFLTSGVTGAAPIWQEIITNLLKDKKDKPFPLPTNIVSLTCFGRIEYFAQGTQSRDRCPKFLPPTPTPTIKR